MNRNVSRICKHLLLGALCFLIAQPLLRIPLVNQLSQQTDFALGYLLYPFRVLLVLSLSAGIFEESFRFLFRRFLLQSSEVRWIQPVAFGLGHGICEALYFLVPAIPYFSGGNFFPAIVERVFAIAFHVGLTVMIWNGFQTGRRVFHLLAAILAHGAINFLATGLQASGYSIWTVEGTLGVLAVLLLFYAVRSKKFYAKGAV